MKGADAICCGVSWWNRRAVGALLGEGGGGVRFVEPFPSALAAARAAGVPLYAWASKLTREAEAEAIAAGVRLTRIEDGFLRSVGLGAGLAAGGSYVIDTRGIYYDAHRESDIEHLLQTAEIGAEERSRAEALASAIVTARVSKYNVGRERIELPASSGRERVLVVGQVAVDAGVRRTLSATIDCVGSGNVNLDLLRLARERNPKAYIVYKPHPDVAAGLRPGHVEARDTARLADIVIANGDITTLIERCDRLETISSLAGFEALLRGRTVSVHGLPFYAGWGLTEDLTVAPRRTRRRSLSELAHIALVQYCRYVDPRTLKPATPEAVVESLRVLRASRLHGVHVDMRRRISWLGRKLGF